MACVLLGAAACGVAGLGGCHSTTRSASAAPAGNVQYTYASPEEAALALANAAAAVDGDALRLVFGPHVSMLSSGDATQDDLDLQRFALAYDEAHSIRQDSPGVCSLVVGTRGWVFPVPIVRDGDRWYFDTVAGGEIVRQARIESNEAAAITALTGLAAAQLAYAAADPDGDGRQLAAPRIVSTQGARDGLYWSNDLANLATLANLANVASPATLAGPESPVGVGLAVADAGSLASPTPADGYLFRVVPPTGDRGTTSIVMLAFPAVHGETGLNTYVIADGVIWRSDRGATSTSEAMAMRSFAPDSTWVRVNQP